MPNRNQRNPYKERIPQYMSTKEDLLYKEIPSLLRNGCQLYTTIKISKPSQIKVRVIFLTLALQSCRILSNLIFGGSLAGIKPVFFVTSSLFLFHRFYLGHMRTVQLTNNFWHHHKEKCQKHKKITKLTTWLVMSSEEKMVGPYLRHLQLAMQWFATKVA